jgi:TRAP transporter 4TM/12TM fusion protein
MATQADALLGVETADTSEAEKLDFEGESRKLPDWLMRIMSAIMIAYALFHLAVLNFYPMDEWVYRVLHVNMGALIAMITLRGWRGQRGRTVPIWDWALAAGAIGCSAYIIWQIDELLLRTGVVTTTGDFICGALGTYIVIEFSRRVSGWILPIIALTFVAYVFAGPVLPGVLHHEGFDTGNIFSFLYSQDGIFGITAAASSRYIILFVAFAVFLNACGTGDYFMKLAMSMVGWSRGGPAKVSVVSGLMFGTVSGSAVANVVATGTFTIPMMLRAGYPRDQAGAVEATSSTGGQLAPPVMGAGAFIMAEITGIPYSQIVMAALLPCLLFYYACFVSVDRQAVRLGINGLPRSELPNFRALLGDIFLLLPLFVLLYLLMTGYSIIAAGTWGLASTLLVLLSRQLQLSSRYLGVPLVLYAVLPGAGMAINLAGTIATSAGLLVLLVAGWRGNRLPGMAKALRHVVKTTGDGLAQTSRNSLQLIAVMACAGIVVGVLGLTGLGGRLSSIILAVAGHSQPIAFFLAMLITIVLGMGMPTTAAYAIAAAVVAPALQLLGISALAAHMFVFYCAVISAITPPVAIAAFAAAAISGGSPWATSIQAMRLGVAAFILPYMFYSAPEILMLGSGLEIAWVFGTALVAVTLIAIASEGQLYGALGWGWRVACGMNAILLLTDSVPLGSAGLAMAATIVLLRFRSGRLQSLTATTATGSITT